MKKLIWLAALLAALPLMAQTVQKGSSEKNPPDTTANFVSYTTNQAAYTILSNCTSSSAPPSFCIPSAAQLGNWLGLTTTSAISPTDMVPFVTGGSANQTQAYNFTFNDANGTSCVEEFWGIVGWGCGFSGVTAGTTGADIEFGTNGTSTPGAVICSDGTDSSTTNRCAITNGSSSGLNNVRFGEGPVYGEWRVKPFTVGDASNNYVTMMGFQDSLTADSTDGIYWRQNFNVNGGKWESVCRTATVETAVDTGVAYDSTTFQEFAIGVNAAGTVVTFYHNRAALAGANTCEAHIPTTTAATGFVPLSVRKIATTSATEQKPQIDYAKISVGFTTPR